MELTTITLPSGTTAKIKPWLTGREKRKVREVFLKDIELKTDETGKSVASGVKGSLVDAAENIAIETVVVELDGKTDDILNRVLDMRSDDYDALMASINEVTSEKKSSTK